MDRVIGLAEHLLKHLGPFCALFFSRYGIVVMLVAAAYLAGALLTRSVRYSSRLERFTFSTAIGFGVLALSTYVLGLLGVLSRATLGAVILGVVLLSYRIWRPWLSVLRSTPGSLKQIPPAKLLIGFVLLLGAVVVVLPFLALPLYPPTAFDATMYHLPTAKLYLQSHGIRMTPFVRYPLFPQLGEMVLVDALAFSDAVAAQLTQTVMLALTLMGSVAFAKRVFTRRVGWWAAAITVSFPLVIWLGTTAYIDATVMAFVTLAVFAFEVYAVENDKRWLATSAVLVGFAAGTKYTALFFVAALGLLAIVKALQRRDKWVPVTFGFAVLASAAPWYCRSLVLSGNPVWPFLGGVFGYGIWNAGDLAGQMVDISTTHIVSRTVVGFLRLPWDLAWRIRLFLHEAPLSPILAALPLAFFGVLHQSGRRLLLICLSFLLFWYASSQIPRYLVPVVPILSVLVAWGLNWCTERFLGKRKWAASALVTLLGVCILALPGWVYATRQLAVLGLVPASQREQTQFLARHLPTYTAYAYLSDTKGAKYVLYVLYDENMNYFADGTFMGDHFGPVRYRDVLSPGVDGPTLYTRLRALGADHLLVNLDRLPPQLPLPQDEWFAQHFRVLFASVHACLYELSEGPVSRVESPELLSNPGFEQVRGALPIGWNAEGNPTLKDVEPRTGVYAAQGSGATNAFFQTVPAQAGNLYILRESVRAGIEGQQARLQVNWLDQQSRFLSFDIRVIEPGRNWDEYEMWVSAPDGAAYACVYASSHEKSLVEFDDMSFRQVTYAD